MCPGRGKAPERGHPVRFRCNLTVSVNLADNPPLTVSRRVKRARRPRSARSADILSAFDATSP
jgi:hypothetical protein